MPFYSRTDRSVEGFMVDRYTQIRDLDENITESQLCSCLVTLLPMSYQSYLPIACIKGLLDLLEAVRRLVLVYDTNEARKE